ncbi:MAG: glycerol-3-phosphate 1-O-acyltransferase PlsY [Eubacteriales bacterium]
MKVLEFLAVLVFGNTTPQGLVYKWFQNDDGVISVTSMIWMLLIVLAWMIVSYLLGSINFSLLISKLAFKDDIRKYGSQNAGTTNMGRVYGRKIGALTLMGDAAKGIVSVLIARLLLGDSAAHLCGLCCMLGHCFPIFYRFKGGKGVATAAAVIFAMNPVSGIIILGIFLIVAIGMHYVSLGSIMGALFYPLVQRSITKLFTGALPTALMAVSAIAMSLLLIARHHSNIKRLLEGTERKFYISKKKKEAAEASSKASDTPKSLHTIDDEDKDDEN